ncbi:MAG: WYL domain-containing protein, partial [Aeriscardovia sp.]|nr:WYL domain-containing protein [Aeriscardovia sp.]
YDREEIPIVFAVSNNKAPYIKTKPIHETQREFIETEQKEWKQRYPMLDNYRFFEIECIPNNELMSILFSFDKDIIVISPKEIRNAISNELREQIDLYSSIRDI